MIFSFKRTFSSAGSRGSRRNAENYEMRLSGGESRVWFCRSGKSSSDGATVRRNCGGFAQAAAVLIDGLRLCIPARRGAGRPGIAAEEAGVLHFPETHWKKKKCRLPGICLSQTTTWCTNSSPLGSLFSPPLPPWRAPLLRSPPRTYRQHRESFASRAPTVRKLNERLQLCSRRYNEPRSLPAGAVYFTNLLLARRYDELLNYPLAPRFRPRRFRILAASAWPVRAPCSARYFISFPALSKWRSSAPVSRVSRFVDCSEL